MSVETREAVTTFEETVDETYDMEAEKCVYNSTKTKVSHLLLVFAVIRNLRSAIRGAVAALRLSQSLLPHLSSNCERWCACLAVLRCNAMQIC